MAISATEREELRGLARAALGERGADLLMAGLGNPDSWMSCSHGAGRRLSRTQAKKQYTAADLARKMTGKVWLSDRAASLVDEIPSAYKNIDQVMADQADLVEVRHTLRQVLNYKGT